MHVLRFFLLGAVSTAAFAVPLFGLPSAGVGGRAYAQQAGGELALPDVAVFDIVCRYKNETYTLHGRAIQRTGSPAIIQFHAAPANDLNYLFPTGTCADLCAYFDPYALRPSPLKEAALLKTLPAETVDGVPCRVVEVLNPPAPPPLIGQAVPVLSRVTLRWYIAADGQPRRVTGTFGLFAPDGKTASADLLVMDAVYTFHDPTAGAFRPASAPPLRTLEVPYEAKSAVREIAASPVAPLLAVAGNDGSIGVWNADTLQPVYGLTHHAAWGQALAFSANGQRLASGTAGGVGSARIWDMATGKLIQTIETKSLGIHSVALSPDGRLLATKGFSAGVSEPVRVWDVETGKTIAEVDDKGASQCVFSPDGKTLATASHDTVRLWNTSTWGETLRLRAELEIGTFLGLPSLAFSPDGKLLAIGETHSGGFLIGLGSEQASRTNPATLTRVWDTQTGKLLQTLPGTTGPIHSLAFSPDSKTLAVADPDTTEEGGGKNSAVQLWNAQTWKRIGVAAVEHGKSIDRVAWTADNKALVTTYSDATVKLWAVPAP